MAFSIMDPLIVCVVTSATRFSETLLSALRIVPFSTRLGSDHTKNLDEGKQECTVTEM